MSGRLFSVLPIGGTVTSVRHDFTPPPGSDISTSVWVLLAQTLNPIAADGWNLVGQQKPPPSKPVTCRWTNIAAVYPDGPRSCSAIVAAWRFSRHAF